VYVTGLKVTDAKGFVEPITTRALEDSRRDLVDKGFALRPYQLVNDRKNADLVLTITGRGS
jgi:hypothetical protein